MPDEIKRVDYYYTSVPDKPGEGARILAALRDAGVSLIGVSAFPHGARRSQLDLIPEDSATFVKAARAAGLKLSPKKSGFLIQGEDRPGAVADIAKKLAEANINVTSVQIFCAGSGRYGGMLWVKRPISAKPPKRSGLHNPRRGGPHALRGVLFRSDPDRRRHSRARRRDRPRTRP